MYLPIAHRVGQNAERLTEIWAWLKDFFASASVTKIVHNLAFESQFLYAQGIVVQEPCYDTIAVAQLVYKNEKEFRTLGDFGLKTLVPEYFHEQLQFNKLIENKDEILENCRLIQTTLSDCSKIDKQISDLQSKLEVWRWTFKK